MAGAGTSLENGRRWRMVVAGEWQALENGRKLLILAPAHRSQKHTGSRDMLARSNSCLGYYS